MSSMDFFAINSNDEMRTDHILLTYYWLLWSLSLTSQFSVYKRRSQVSVFHQSIYIPQKAIKLSMSTKTGMYHNSLLITQLIVEFLLCRKRPSGI